MDRKTDGMSHDHGSRDLSYAAVSQDPESHDHESHDPVLNDEVDIELGAIGNVPNVAFKFTSARDSDLDPELDDTLTPAEKSQLNRDYTRLLDDISGKPQSEVTPRNLDLSNLKEGFFTAKETPRHFLGDDDISEHHRTGDFPHLRHLVRLGPSSKKKVKGQDSRGKGHRKGGQKRSDRHKRKKEESENGEQDWAESGKKRGAVFPTIAVTPPDTDIIDGADQSEKIEPNKSTILQPTTEETEPADLTQQSQAYESPIFTLEDTTPQNIIPTKLLLDDIGSDSDFSTTPTVGFFIGDDDIPSPDPGKRSIKTPHPTDDRKVSFSFTNENEFEAKDVGKDEKKDQKPSTSQKERVKFSLGSDDGSKEQLQHSKTMPGDIVYGSHSRSRRHSKVPSQMDLEARRLRGSEVKLGGRRSSAAETTLTSEYSQLDLDNMASHRFADPRGLQRRRISSHTAATSVIQVEKLQPSKPKHDHNPHELFVELDELHTGEDKHYEWKEKARWIKYEEDVEEGANKWGKPHVSSLSFHSLLDLRRCIEQGVVMLDLEEDNLPSIASCITEELVKTKQLSPSNRGKVLRVLLLKHRHMDQRGFLRRNSTFFQLHSARDESDSPERLTSDHRGSLFPWRKTPPSLKRLSSMPDTSEMPHNGTPNHPDNKKPLYERNHSDPTGSMNKPHTPLSPVVEQSESKESVGSIPRNKSMSDASIMKRIPDGAETTSVLVGSVDYLDKPIMAFVRLSQGCDLENLTEVPLPVRFLFLLMGPPHTRMDYHEIGRSISTLMANTSFHDVAYMAEDRTDLLKALNSFLDESIVLPPGEIDKKVLLPIIYMAKQREKEKRKRKKEKKVVTEPPIPPFDPLKRTGRPFGGVVNDIKKRYPFYWSDIKDGLNLQCLATFFFVYFACLSPAITFGGLLSEKTATYMGVTEMLVGTFACGVVFALVSGQPLLIMGGTGPVLVFEEGLFQFCSSVGLDFLSMRCWVGFWVAVVVTVMIAAEGVFLVRYFTRFTEEIFASLISLIFIIEVFIKINKQFENHPLQEYYEPIPGCIDDDEQSTLSSLAQSSVAYITNMYNPTTQPTTGGLLSNNGTELPGNQTTAAFDESLCFKNRPNTALLSVILTFGTFFIAYFLKQFRNSQFLGRNARRALGDFGIPIAIVTMLIIDVIIGDKAYTEKLNVPDGMVPTNATKRGWLVNPAGHASPLPVWAMFAAAIPALLLFILLFMESLITSVIVNKKLDINENCPKRREFISDKYVIVNKSERKLKKGTGYHLDMMLVGIFAAFCGVIGTPFLSVATVRSVTHVSALTVYSKSHAPGDKPKLVEVKEQRLTSFLVHIMIGLSTLLGPVLRHIPLAVLFGVFLYMGIASMSGIQLFDRVNLLFMPVKHHPDAGYARKVRLWKMNLFTMIQLVCLGLLWAIKSTKAALAFPFVLLLMVPVRLHLLKFVFTKEELSELDGSGEQAEESDKDTDDEPDFYEQAHMPF